MMNRRRLLMTACAGGALGLMGTGQAQAQAEPGQAPGASPASAQLKAVLDRITEAALLTDPELLTMMGMDSGERAIYRSRLSDRSLADRAKKQADLAEAVRGLAGIRRDDLGAEERVYYDTTRFFMETMSEGKAFPYGGGLSPEPYVVSQLTGAYQSIPDFLDSQHRIETAADAEAYIDRLSAFAGALKDEREAMQADFAAGAVPPDFIIDKTLTQMRTLMGTPADQSTLVQSITRRAGEKGIAGDWERRATAILADEIKPALQAQIEALEAVRPQANSDAGAWRLPQGEAYFRFGLKYYTTSDMTPDEVHQMGLDQVAEISARADAILKSQGLTQGTVGQRIAALGQDPRFLYPDTDEAKEDLLQELNRQTEAMQARLPEYFGRLPSAPVEIRRVPKAIEAGAPGGYYMPPSLDGSRPGAYYINLRDTAEWPRWTLPTLTYHEATPGHHHQIALQQERTSTPLLLKLLGSSAYSEGWGLYAEQLADEMGVYENDPFGQIGYLQSLMFRAARLVVDTGLHHKRWSREQGIRYMVDALGDKETTITTEVERYCVWPGQACSYKVGHATWVKAREAARARLGSRFDIRQFHDAGLNLGGVPLMVLERELSAWTPV